MRKQWASAITQFLVPNGLNSSTLTRGQIVNQGYQMKFSIAVKDTNCLNNDNKHKNPKESYECLSTKRQIDSVTHITTKLITLYLKYRI